MKLLYLGQFSPGSTALHRMEAIAAQAGVEIIPHEAESDAAVDRRFVARLHWRAGWPLDTSEANRRLIDAVRKTQPDVILIDSSKVITQRTLKMLRMLSVRILVYYSPDDIVASRNLSWPLRMTFREWDIVFTTKRFNIAELAARGVRRPCLMGNAFNPRDHRPFTPEQVGSDFERFDLVFVGTYERSRAASILRLAKSGMGIVIYGNDAGVFERWRSIRHSNIVLRPAVYAEDYSRCLHHGKVALCFLRKRNRDTITTRSVEIPAASRPMLAEKTTEHDAHFVDGMEYIGFSDDDALVANAHALLADSGRRLALARAGRARCLASGYDNNHRASAMIAEIKRALESQRMPKGRGDLPYTCFN